MKRALIVLLMLGTLPSFGQSGAPQSSVPQSSVPMSPSAGRTLTTPPPPPPPEDTRGTANPIPGGPDRPRDPARERPRDRATDPPAQGTPRVPPAADIAQRPTPGAASTLRRELLVASVDITQAELQRAWLTGRGAQLLRRKTLKNLGWVLTVYRLAPDTTLAPLKRELEQEWPDAMAEANARFEALGETASQPATPPALYARDLIGWPAGCATQGRIAMLDGPVSGVVPALVRARLHVESFVPGDVAASYDHGTSLAVLLVGEGAPGGLHPGAELAVGVIMSADDDGPYTTTEWIVRGLDWVLGLDPRPLALNLSFGGSRSAQLERALERVTRAMPVAAAAGNEARREVSFPAAYPGVIAVAAVDARSRRWSKSNTGAQVAIAAPGVEVWTLDGAGRGHYANGTSIATLFVTAALAASPPAPDHIEQWLDAHARDAGKAGKDPEFGFGVLSLGGTCERTST